MTNTDPYIKPLVQACLDTYTPGRMPWFINKAGTCQVYKSFVLGRPCYAFGATRTTAEWLVDFLALEVPFKDHPNLGPVHEGFWIDTEDAVKAIMDDLAAAGHAEFFLTGHSKGASEGLLAMAELALHGAAALAGRFFEPAMIGTGKLTNYMAQFDVGWTRTVNAHGPDEVTRVPPWSEWQHQGVLTELVVPDTYNNARKHEIAAVVAAVMAL